MDCLWLLMLAVSQMQFTTICWSLHRLISWLICRTVRSPLCLVHTQCSWLECVIIVIFPPWGLTSALQPQAVHRELHWWAMILAWPPPYRITTSSLPTSRPPSLPLCPACRYALEAVRSVLLLSRTAALVCPPHILQSYLPLLPDPFRRAHLLASQDIPSACASLDHCCRFPVATKAVACETRTAG